MIGRCIWKQRFGNYSMMDTADAEWLFGAETCTVRILERRKKQREEKHDKCKEEHEKCKEVIHKFKTNNVRNRLFDWSDRASDGAEMEEDFMEGTVFSVVDIDWVTERKATADKVVGSQRGGT